MQLVAYLVLKKIRFVRNQAACKYFCPHLIFLYCWDKRQKRHLKWWLAGVGNALTSAVSEASDSVIVLGQLGLALSKSWIISRFCRWYLVVYDGYLSGVTVMAVPITGEDLLPRVTWYNKYPSMVAAGCWLPHTSAGPGPWSPTEDGSPRT